MKFSERELICFNSILDGERIFGTRFCAPKKPDPEYTKETLRELREHGLLKEEDRPNKSFMAIVNTLKEYKNAEQYLIVNHMKIGLIKDKPYLILLAKGKDGYELSAIKKELFLYQFMGNCASIARQDTGEKEDIKKLSLAQWHQEFREQKVEDLICLQSISRTQIGKTQLLYSVNGEGCIYEVQKEEYTKCGSLKMRILLMELFEITIKEAV